MAPIPGAALASGAAGERVELEPELLPEGTGASAEATALAPAVADATLFTCNDAEEAGAASCSGAFREHATTIENSNMPRLRVTVLPPSLF